jgi:exodeoxyribonuclease VII large subunit
LALKELSVSEISNIITRIFDAEEMLHDIKIYGEISGFQIVRGHAYFSIKDENALLSCVMFGVGHADIKDGDQVLVTGRLGYYGKSGKLQFYASVIVPYGQGILYQKFLALKERLEKEGLFDSSSKKPIPKVVKNIGVVTSETGAVIQDIINIVGRRNPCVNIFLYPVRVQGVGAENSICEGVEYFSRHKNVDVIVIARGGGSFEDLMPFNSEILARTIYASELPVVSAVGHETDFTICDFVSNLRAPTPSAAAELLTQDPGDVKSRLAQNLTRMLSLYTYFLQNNTAYLDDFMLKLGSDARHVIEHKKQRFVDIVRRLLLLSGSAVQRHEGALGIINERLLGHSPAAILDRGFVKVFKDGKAVVEAGAVNVGDKLRISLRDGDIETVTEKIDKKEN